MPVIIPEALPATNILKESGVFVMTKRRAQTQDIRPLKICILNLMPDKITTETQLLSKLSNGIIQIEITLLAIKNHTSKNTAQTHLDTFYSHFENIKDQYFDGLIVTGAPVEMLGFEEITYWQELQEILTWSKTNVFCSLFICWASQVALYHFYGITKHCFQNKLFGVYPHQAEEKNSQLLIGMDSIFYVPQARNTESDPIAIRKNPHLKVIASSKQAGIHITSSLDERQVFMSGHPEYDKDSILKEYLRDINEPFNKIPENYFQDDDPAKEIQTLWQSHGSLFYQNWLNYFVYQKTWADLNTADSKVLFQPC